MSLIERLRAGYTKPISTPPEFDEAADRIEELEAEVEHVRGELKLARQGAEYCFNQAKEADANASVQNACVHELSEQLAENQNTIKKLQEQRDELLAALNFARQGYQFAFENGCPNEVEWASMYLKSIDVAIASAKDEQPDNLRGFALWFAREDWGHVVDGLILERERSEKRKEANPESNSNDIADNCSKMIETISAAASVKGGVRKAISSVKSK